MKGCNVVMHLATPVLFAVPKGKEEELMLKPAIRGTRNVLGMIITTQCCSPRLTFRTAISRDRFIFEGNQLLIQQFRLQNMPRFRMCMNDPSRKFYLYINNRRSFVRLIMQLSLGHYALENVCQINFNDIFA